MRAGVVSEVSLAQAARKLNLEHTCGGRGRKYRGRDRASVLADTVNRSWCYTWTAVATGRSFCFKTADAAIESKSPEGRKDYKTDSGAAATGRLWKLPIGLLKQVLIMTNGLPQYTMETATARDIRARRAEQQAAHAALRSMDL